MDLETFLSKNSVIDLSFFNFENAVTAAYFANSELEILKVNRNFRSFFPVLGNISNAYFPDVLKQLGVPDEQIKLFIDDLSEKGAVLIPRVDITTNGEERVFSLLSARTQSDTFSYLNGLQGQFIDRTEEWKLRREKQTLLEEQLRDRGTIEEKSRQLEHLAKRLAKYLSPQIYQSLFRSEESNAPRHSRKNLTLFFSDIVQFTDLTDSMEPERLAAVINSYLSEMSVIALEHGGTIDKFIGDAIVVFFGDPESDGDTEDALKCVDMALQMQRRITDLQKHWRKLGANSGIRVRMGISTGFCTVGNFGSELRLDYTVLGSPVNLAARLEGKAAPGSILIDENTFSLISDHINATLHDTIKPKGFTRSVNVFEVDNFKPERKRSIGRRLSRAGERVEINVLDASNLEAAVEELRQIQREFETDLVSRTTKDT
jgi:class 3 adenylate cyclase